MEVQFLKWADDLAIRVPKEVAETLDVTVGSVAEMEVSDGDLFITTRRHAYRLYELLEGITADNLHGEISTGGPVGNEAHE